MINVGCIFSFTGMSTSWSEILIQMLIEKLFYLFSKKKSFKQYKYFATSIWQI